MPTPSASRAIKLCGTTVPEARSRRLGRGAIGLGPYAVARVALDMD